MATYKSVIRKTPSTTLRTFFEGREFGFVEQIDWTASEPEVTKGILSAFDAMDADEQERVIVELGRVAQMSDDAGTAAMQYVMEEPDQLELLANGHDRALWLYLTDINVFRHAEDARFTDERRRRSTWTGFIGEANVVVRRDNAAIEKFKASLRDQFSAKNVHVDVFERRRVGFDGSIYHLVQFTIYREGLPDAQLRFDQQGTLMRRTHRPVFEAAMTYEPLTGVIEVVGGNTATREALAKTLSADMLGTEFGDSVIPLRRYDLRRLLKPFDFPTDIEDGIEGVEVRTLRLMPVDTNTRRVTLECMAREDATIWSMADQEFGEATPLRTGWVITQATLVIRFAPPEGSRRSRLLSLTITMPHGCDLKEMTEQQQIIGQKYLRRWGVLIDDEPLIEN